jgi:hypothetical protein
MLGEVKLFLFIVILGFGNQISCLVVLVDMFVQIY